jgi:tetratricopeptide (TPR) repeat protein
MSAGEHKDKGRDPRHDEPVGDSSSAAASPPPVPPPPSGDESPIAHGDSYPTGPIPLPNEAGYSPVVAAAEQLSPTTTGPHPPPRLPPDAAEDDPRAHTGPFRVDQVDQHAPASEQDPIDQAVGEQAVGGELAVGGPAAGDLAVGELAVGDLAVGELAVGELAHVDGELLDLDDELDQPELDGPPTTTTAQVLPDASFYDDESQAFDALRPPRPPFSTPGAEALSLPSDAPPPPEGASGEAELSEGEEAISDTFRSVPEAELSNVEPLPQLRGRFIGRTTQLSTLRDLFLEARQSSRLCFVSLLGAPGAGKSRLAREFARSVRAAFSNARVLWGETQPAGSGRRYEVVARAVEERVGIGRDDTPEDALAKIEQAIEESLPENYRAEVAPLVAHLLGVPYPDSPLLESLASTPRQLELRSYIAVRRFLQYDAERGPLLLCFDGMEQSSDDSVKLVHYLADGLQHRSVMILAAARHTVLRRHPNWGQGDFDAHAVQCEPMPPADAQGLLCELAQQDADVMPAELTHIARDRLGGSPRAITDFVRFLLESGVLTPDEGRFRLSRPGLGQVSLPRSHEDILRARLRALPGSERSLLEKAAAIGEAFWLDATVALVRAAAISHEDPDGPTLQEIAAAGEKTRFAVAATLNRLRDRGLVVDCAESSIVGEREFRFAYAPIWDLTYEGLDELPKRRYHRLGAQWLEARPEGRDELRQALVARHLEQSGDRRGAAARYRRAADAARARFANQRAIRLYESALECLADSDLVTRLHLWHDLGSVYQHRGDFDNALDAFERMVRLGWVVASRPKAAVAFNKMGRVWRGKGNLNLALEYLHRSLEMFREAGDERGVATSLDDVGQVQWMLGRYEPALDRSAKALEMRRQAGDKRSIAVSLSNIGNIEKDRGLFDEAYSCYSEALRLRREVGDHYGYVVSLNNLAALAYERGSLDEARETWESALAEADRIGAVPLSLILLNNLGEVAIKDNKAAEARERLEQALALATEIDDQRSYIDILRNLALLELLEGRPDRARRYARECLNLARRGHLPEMVGKAQIALAEIAAQTLFDASAENDTANAEGYFEQAIKVFREMGNEAELAKALRRLGEYRVEHGQIANGSESLREAVSLFAKLGMPDAEALERVLVDLDQTGPSFSSDSDPSSSSA